MVSLKRERVMGIEPTYPAWKAGVLPLNYTRIKCLVPESNQRHEDFQSSALPTELTRHCRVRYIRLRGTNSILSEEARFVKLFCDNKLKESHVEN